MDSTQNDHIAKRNTVLLSGGQALYGSNMAVLITLSGLAGVYLSPDPAYATLPISAMVVGTALSTVPASLFMPRTSRRRGFMWGTAAGIFGASLALNALFVTSFDLFCVSVFLCGDY